MDHMDAAASARITEAVRTIRRGLAPYRARGLRTAAELDKRATAFLTRT
ncbi:hypothetical protein [Streptomyces specialis]|nr:hypothetical protein [Streptomyces specialis]